MNRTKGGRPPGPIRKYTVEFVWPSDPGFTRQRIDGVRSGSGYAAEKAWRGAVRGVDEATARRSATALLNMRHKFRVRIVFVKASLGQPQKGHCVASEWDPLGRVVYRHKGSWVNDIPAWALGLEPLEIPKQKKERDRELVVSGS